jgi:hypothetical protein
MQPSSCFCCKTDVSLVVPFLHNTGDIYIHIYIQRSTVRIQTPTHWNLIGRSIVEEAGWAPRTMWTVIEKMNYLALLGFEPRTDHPIAIPALEYIPVDYHTQTYTGYNNIVLTVEPPQTLNVTHYL